MVRMFDENMTFWGKKKIKNVDWLLIGSRDEETAAEIPETEDRSNNIMEHNTDRGGHLEVEDDGPY